MGKVKSGFYAVRTGRSPGIYNTWSECEDQVKGFPGARYKKFGTQAEAQAFVDSPTTVVENYENTALDLIPLGPAMKTASAKPSSLRKSNVRFNPIKDTKSKKPISTCASFSSLPSLSEKVDEDSCVVWTDGACESNGKKGARAGIGVYWGQDSPLNLSERLIGRQTNNRAEIQACVKALRQVEGMGKCRVKLHTDSKFVIQAMTEWIKKWKKNKWQLVSGGPVKNQEDFMELDDMCSRIQVEWVHVRGHQGVHGNEEADKLAVQGARMPYIHNLDDSDY